MLGAIVNFQKPLMYVYLLRNNLLTCVTPIFPGGFKAISSLQEIIVEVYEDGPSDHIRREMKNHGWTISATEYVEEPDFDSVATRLELTT
jgi:hypothetical protein